MDLGRGLERTAEGGNRTNEEGSAGGRGAERSDLRTAVKRCHEDVLLEESVALRILP